ncbi:MAG: histidine kinase [Pseudomonadales bacterium]|nr:histidine kinase [Pseudomonadales bacterium]
MSSSASQQSGERFYLPDLCKGPTTLFLILLGQLLAIIFSVAVMQEGRFDWFLFSLMSFFIIWVILPSAAFLCHCRKWLIRLAAWQGTIVCYLFIMLVTATVSMGGQWFMTRYLSEAGEGSFDPVMTVRHLVITAILAGVFLRYFFLQRQLELQQQAELASRIQALQSRIRPHFLFNSMNIIASLIETEPETAERVVEDLSALFRATLAEASNEVTVQEEIDLCRRYIAIEQLRMGEDRLRVDWQVAPEAASVKLPHLCIQPLLENAVYHGVHPLPQGGEIRLSVSLQNKRLQVQVSNPYPGKAVQTHHKGNKLALENLQRRLLANYGASARLEIDDQDNIFTVTFSYQVDKETT